MKILSSHRTTQVSGGVFTVGETIIIAAASTLLGELAKEAVKFSVANLTDWYKGKNPSPTCPK